MNETRAEELIPYRRLCEWGGFVYPSVMRWKTRIGAGEEPVLRPGPKKVAPLDFEVLREEIRDLKHGRKRTEGAGRLYEQHREQISRRDLNLLVAEERRRQTRERRDEYQQVTWRVPRLIWAMDDAQMRLDEDLPMFHLHTIQDLGSRYKFDPLVGWHLACGEQVAENLETLFRIFGPPLFFKRDNGPNLNHQAVDKVLQDHLVLPLNSPCYYPQYNGGVEFAQREIKAQLVDTVPLPLLRTYVQLEVHCINFQPRPVLGMRCSAEVFRSARDLASLFPKRKRKEVYQEITINTLNLIEREEYSEDDAWRRSVQTWLLENHFISMNHKPRVSPYSLTLDSHN